MTHLLATVDDATSNLYLLTAFGGGIISFLSPCVLPIVPGYLGLITGLSMGELQEEKEPRTVAHIVLNTGLFVAGFTVVFVLLGLITTAAGDALFQNQDTLARVSGGLVLLMAAYLAGSQLLLSPRLYQEFRFHPHFERFGVVAAPVAGAAFGLGWSPCIGPILGSVLGFAAQGENLARATLLLVAYSLGLGLSFLVVGLAFGRLSTALTWFRQHARALTLVSAAVLALFGLVLLTGNLSQLTARMTDVMDALGLGRLVNI